VFEKREVLFRRKQQYFITDLLPNIIRISQNITRGAFICKFGGLNKEKV
jgi:hypothetical protein